MTTFTKEASKSGKAKLVAAGWTNVMTLMSDSDDGKYGVMFTRNGETFWFNKETFHNLPV